MTYLDFGATKAQRFLYRIASLDRFVEALSSGENVLVSPSKWEDPFDGYILNAYGVLPGGAMVAFRLRNNYFGQCWSLHRETDLMWRAYSPQKDGVKLRVRADKLHDSLDSNQRGSGNGQTFLGYVSYKRKPAFDETLRRGCDFGTPSESQARALLVKRYGFRSEREVRLIAYAEHHSATGLFRYPVKWNDLLDQAVLDPRMSYTEARKAKQRIRAAGYAGLVIRSGLYKKPPPLKFGVDLNGTPSDE